MTTSTFFPIFNCGFGISLNFDAVLRDSRATMCGIVVFVPPLRPPPVKLGRTPDDAYIKNINVISVH